MAVVSIRNLRKSYGKVEAVRGVDLEIADKEFVVLVGPSGCGKSTTLRMIAGLEDITSGEIHIGDQLVNELEPKDRDIAMVFQDYALYPHMSVFENMAFGLRYRGHPKTEIQRRVEEAANILDIQPLLARRPKQLSGGQRQRVAMGRAIVRNPQVFLFDEPLSNLDAKLRGQMRTEIKRLHRRLATTIIYVTHDQVEAMTLADRIVIMRDGIIEQVGTPDEVYNAPCTTYVAGFIGSPTMNLFAAEMVVSGSAAAIRLADGTSLPLSAEWTRRLKGAVGGAVTVGVRPEDFRVSEGAVPMLRARPEVIEPMGSDTLVLFRLGKAEIIARLSPRHIDLQSETIALDIDLERLHFFDARTGKAIP